MLASVLLRLDDVQIVRLPAVFAYFVPRICAHRAVACFFLTLFLMAFPFQSFAAERNAVVAPPDSNAGDQSRGGAPEVKVVAPSEQPFWRRKLDLLRRIYDERAIIVSASTEKVAVMPAGLSSKGSEQILFTIRGAGLIHAPKAFAFRTAQQYRKLKDVSSHFKTVEYDDKTHKLFLITEALSWRARMVLLMQPVISAQRDELRWEVIWGSFRGMKGLMAFATAEHGQKTETSIEAIYQAETLPLPKILMGFALETIIQKVAEKMRSFIEHEYQRDGIK